MSSIAMQTKSATPTMLITPSPRVLDDDDLDDYIDPTKPLPKKYWPKVDHLITEDDTPMDNIFSEKQQRLLTESLYTSWAGPEDGVSFIALANVGLFPIPKNPALVPDVLVSLDAKFPADIWEKTNRSYMIWGYGKPPEVVIEIVSNKKGREADYKLQQYARMKVSYYVIYDPNKQLGKEALLIYQLQGRSYVKYQSYWLPDVGLGLTEWTGVYEKMECTWLRWCNQDKNIIATGLEQVKLEQQRTEKESQRAEKESQRAEKESQRAEKESQRAERLAAKLRALGIDPSE